MIHTASRRELRLSALLVLLVSTGFVVAAVNAPAAHAQTAQSSAVYNGTTPNMQGVEYDGIMREVRFVVPNKSGGTDVSQYASTNGAWSQGYGMDNLSIIDVERMASPTSMSYLVTLTNTSSETKTVLAQYELRNNTAAAAMTAGVPTSDNPRVTATLFNNVLPRIYGVLEPGESVTVTVPVTVAGAETVAQWGNVAPFSAGYTQLLEQTLQTTDAAGTQTVRNAIRLFARFSTRLLNSSGNDFFTTGSQYLGTVKSGATYTTVPSDIQALLPNMAASDFTSENVYRTLGASTNFEGVASNYMANGADDSAQYTGGIYFLDTTTIKASLKNTGWSVNNLTHPLINDTDHISDSYSYQTWGGLKIYAADADGQATATVVDSTDRQYVELYQYIKGHDITINVGDTYVAEDTLDWFMTYDGTVIDLTDSRTGADISAVDTETPGRYPVIYTYTPVAGGESVTLTQYVTVVGSLEIPASPDLIDECGTNNVIWATPADTELLDWQVDADGSLSATITAAGYTFTDGTMTHDYGKAVDSQRACPAPSTPSEHKSATSAGSQRLAETGSAAIGLVSSAAVIGGLGLGMMVMRRRMKG